MSTERPLKVLITGAGGMLGTDLVSVLKSGADVAGIEKRPVTHLPIPCEICDLTQFRKTRDCVLGQAPDIVIHSAALTDVDYCEEHHDEALENNVEATKNLVTVCNEIDAPLIFFSTDYIFDGTKKGEYLETDKPQPLNFYGNTKFLAESFIMENAARAMIFRITWLFGRYGRCFPKAILRQAEEVKKMNVVNDQVGRPTYSVDLAQALGTIILQRNEHIFSKEKEVFHVGNHGTVNWAEFARHILKTAGHSDVRVEEITSAQLKRPAPRPANSVLSLNKAKSVLGIELRPWAEAVDEFILNLKQEEKIIHEEKARIEPPEED